MDAKHYLCIFTYQFICFCFSVYKWRRSKYIHQVSWNKECSKKLSKNLYELDGGQDLSFTDR